MRLKNSFLSFALVGSSLLIAACGRASLPTPPTELPPASSEPREEVTHNVTYRGTLEEASISIYMQGTHRLVLDAGRFLLLESATVPLEAYVGNEVEVTGDVRSTVEEGGLIMSVNRIVSFVETSSSEASSEEASPSASSESSEGGSASAAVPSSAPAPASSFATSAAASVAGDSSTPSGALMLRTKEMASVNMDASNWSQKYCTGHIGFCIPVHKNWWYNSFGATTSSFWHVEISSKEITSLGEGPIVLMLVTGAATENDRRVVAAGGDVIGYYSWTGNRHFEIKAPAELRVAIEYIIQNLTPYTEE